MKLINTANNEVIFEIVTNRSMTLEEAIDCIGGEIISDMDDPRWSDDYDNVIIDGERYCYDDLEMDWES